MKTKLKNAIYPSHSPDLSQCDLLFFGYCKNKLKAVKINDDATLLQKVLHVFGEVTFDEHQSVFTVWIDRLKTGIDINGEVVNESVY